MSFRKNAFGRHLAMFIGIFLILGCFGLTAEAKTLMDCGKLRKSYQLDEVAYQKCINHKQLIIDSCERRKQIQPLQDCIEWSEKDWLRRHPDPNYFWTCEDGNFQDTEAFRNCQRIEKEFWTWAGRPFNPTALERKPGAYFLPRHLLICNDKELFKNEFNAIMYNGGYYRPDDLGDGCFALSNSNIGRIAKSFPDSKLILVQYKSPMWKDVREVWTHRDLITPMVEYKKYLVKQ